MEFPDDWPYTQLPNTAYNEQMYDDQQHSYENFLPSSSNWCNLESNFQMSIAGSSDPGRLDHVFPMQSLPDMVMIEYDGGSSLNSWQRQDPGPRNPSFSWETPENPFFQIPGEETWENPENPEFSVSNFIGQTHLTANYSQTEPPQFPNCTQSTDDGRLPFAMDTLEEYDGVSTISSDHEMLVRSLSNDVNYSLEASEAEFNDILRIAKELEETPSQISRETNPGGSTVTTINDRSGIINKNSVGNHTHNLHAEFLNPEIDFRHVLEEPLPDQKKPRLEKAALFSSTDFLETSPLKNATLEEYSQPETTISPMKKMIYCAAALKPVNLDREMVDEKDQKPKRKNVRISSVPQTVAARQRRERISERLKVLQKLVPGGGKLDTASMLEEAANYLKFLKAQIKVLETLGHKIDNSMTCMPMNLMFSPLPFYHSFPKENNNISLYQLQNHTHYFHQPQD